MLNKPIKNILFIPNFPFRVCGGRHFMPRPDFDFLTILTKKNIAIQVFSFCAPKDDPFSDACIENIPTAEMADVDIYSGGGTKIKKIISYLKAMFVGLRVVGRHDGLVYIYFPGPLPIFIAMLCIISRKKFAFYVRGEWQEKGFFGWLARRVFSRADFIFTTGKAFEDTICNVNSQVNPVYPMVSFAEEEFEKKSLRNFTNFKKGIYVGHLRASKGVLDILAGIKIAADNGIVLSVDFVGGGNENDLRLFNNMIAKNNLENHINYLGHISDANELRNHFNTADFFIYPSYYPEGFPRVVYEAMIVGMPIICSVLRGMKGFMRDKKNCLEVPIQCPVSIADRLKMLNDDILLRERIATQAKRDISEYLTDIEHKSHSAQFIHALEGVKL